MDIRTVINEDWKITLEGLGEGVCVRSNFFVEPTLGDYARFVYESFTREWVEDSVDPSDMFELKSVDEQAHHAIFAVKQNAMDFAGEDITVGDQELKLRRDGFFPKRSQD